MRKGAEERCERKGLDRRLWSTFGAEKATTLIQLRQQPSHWEISDSASASMTSAKALAGTSAVPCAQCGFGPSQSFRTEPSSASTAGPFRNHLAPPPSSYNQTKSSNRKAPRWPIAFGKRKGARRAVSMEYGGNMIRPGVTGEREIVSGLQMLQQLRKQLLEAINMEVSVWEPEGNEKRLVYLLLQGWLRLCRKRAGFRGNVTVRGQPLLETCSAVAAVSAAGLAGRVETLSWNF